MGPSSKATEITTMTGTRPEAIKMAAVDEPLAEDSTEFRSRRVDGVTDYPWSPRGQTIVAVLDDPPLESDPAGLS